MSFCLLVVADQKTYDARAAFAQMEMILRLNASGPTISQVSKDYEVVDPRHSFLLSGGRPLASVEDKRKTGFDAVSSVTHQTVRFQIVEDNLFVCNMHRYFNFSSSNVHTLSQEEGFWNSLIMEPVVVDSVISLAGSGVVSDYPTSLLHINNTYSQETQKLILAHRGEILTPLPNSNETSASTSNVESEAVELTLQGEPCEDKWQPLTLYGSKGQRYFNFSVAAIREGVAFELGSIYDEATANDYLEHKSHPAETESYWLRERKFDISRSFSKQFPDLAEAARGRMNEELATLATDIHAESNKGDEAFEVFGIKFQSEQVRRWGIILLIGVQLYFLMYLKRLSSRLKSDDPAWDVPWMAMDRSWLARTMLFFSVLCLPIYASCVVVISAMREASRKTYIDTLFAPTQVILSPLLRSVWILFAFVVSVRLSVLCWKYRPKLTEPVAPLEVLEDQGSGI